MTITKVTQCLAKNGKPELHGFFPASTTLWMKVSSPGESPVSISYPSAISSTARIMNYAPPNSTMHSKRLTKLPTSTNFHATNSASHCQRSSPFELYSFWYLAFASPSPRPFSSWRSAKTPLMIGRKVAAFALYAMPRLVESSRCFFSRICHCDIIMIFLLIDNFMDQLIFANSILAEFQCAN